MSFLKEFAVTPNRVRSIYKWLDYKGSEDHDRLMHLLMPSFYSFEDSIEGRYGTIIEPIIDACIYLGLISKDGNRVCLSEEVIGRRKELKKKVKSDEMQFKLLISDLIFQRYEELSTGIAWLLANNPFEAPRTWLEWEYKITTTGFRDVTKISNDIRYGNFIIWSTFLGFSWVHSHYMPDPTEQLRWRISFEYKSGTEVSIIDFLNKLCAVIPVIDGGKYRREVDKSLNADADENYLSDSLSLALKRLEDLGVIGFIQKSDTVNRALSKSFKPLTFSHIKVL